MTQTLRTVVDTFGRHRHPANQARYDHASMGSRWADRVTNYMGSWRFIGWQTVVVLAWMALNITAVVHHWDPYPFILLNLVFSTQAAYASPLILLAGNRAAEHDRAAAEHDYSVNEAAAGDLMQVLALVRAIHRRVGA